MVGGKVPRWDGNGGRLLARLPSQSWPLRWVSTCCHYLRQTLHYVATVIIGATSDDGLDDSHAFYSVAE